MNRSLLARTRPEFYAEYAQRLREGGATEDEIKSCVDDSIRRAQFILSGKCPKCGAPIARYAGRWPWIMYRCSTAPPPGHPRGNACDFLIDLKEGDEAS